MSPSDIEGAQILRQLQVRVQKRECRKKISRHYITVDAWVVTLLGEEGRLMFHIS